VRAWSARETGVFRGSSSDNWVGINYDEQRTGFSDEPGFLDWPTTAG